MMDNISDTLKPDHESIYDAHGLKEEELDSIKALPPSSGRFPVSPVQEFVSILNAVSRIYKNPDSAIIHNRENARRMRYDLSIQAPLNIRKMATAQLPWHLDPDDSNDVQQKEVCKKLTHCIEQIPDLQKLFMALLEGIFLGRSAVQIKYKWDFSTGNKRLIVDEWSPVHGDSIVFRFDDNRMGVLVGNYFRNAIYGTRQLTTQPSDIARTHMLTAWEREAFLLYQHERVGGDFFEPERAGLVKGAGLRDLIYYTYYLKQEALGWLMSAVERYSMGVRIFFYEAGNAQSEAETRKAAEAQCFNNILLWPRRMTPGEKEPDPFLFIPPDTSGILSLKDLIETYFEKKIEKLIIGHELNVEAKGSGLGSGMASLAQKSFARIIRYDSDSLAGALSRDLVKVLLKYNFDNPKFNVKFCFNLESVEPREVLDAAKLLFDMNVELDADELRSKVNLKKPTADSVIIKKQEQSDVNFQAFPKM